MADVADLIGKPFRYGGRGPDAYDCYGLVREMCRRDGKPVPDFKSPSELAVIEAVMAVERASGKWQEVAKGPGRILLLRVGALACHVAYTLPDDRMIHTWEKSNGVCIERIEGWRRRIVGFYDYLG